MGPGDDDGMAVVVVCCESATHRLTLLPGHLLDKGWPPVGRSAKYGAGNIGIMRPLPEAPPAITPPVTLFLRSGWQKGQTTAAAVKKEGEAASLSRPHRMFATKASIETVKKIFEHILLQHFAH